MKAVNLDTYNLSLVTAKEDVLNPRSSINWALFRYEGFSNNLKLSDSGVGGLAELRGKFHASRALYGLCQVAVEGSELRRVIMITWVGEGVDEYRRAEYASHLPAIREFFKEASMFVNARNLDDVTEERISSMGRTAGTSAFRGQSGSCFSDKAETVGTNYRRTVAAMEIQKLKRDSFWARSEREEEERKAEELRRALEERRRLEKERVLQERREAEERERKMQEKERVVQEQRRIQAEEEAEAQRQEMLRWEQQKKQHEEEMRAAFTHSHSFSEAAEAAALVSQRSGNPREFFRQLSSSSAQEPVSPVSPRSGRPPFRRYHRSLTNTAFIFGRTDLPNPIEPQGPTVQSASDTSPEPVTEGLLSAGSQDIHDPPSPGSSAPPCVPVSVLSPQPHKPNPVHNTSMTETPSVTPSLDQSDTSPEPVTEGPLSAGSQDIHDPPSPGSSAPPCVPVSVLSPQPHKPTAVHNTSMTETPSATPSTGPVAPDLLTCHSDTPLLQQNHFPLVSQIALISEDALCPPLEEVQHPQGTVGALVDGHLDLETDLKVHVMVHIPDTNTSVTTEIEEEDDSMVTETSCSMEKIPKALQVGMDGPHSLREEDSYTFSKAPSCSESTVDVSGEEEISPRLSSVTTGLNEGGCPEEDASSDRDSEAGERPESPGQASPGTVMLDLLGQAEEEETYESLTGSLWNTSIAPAAGAVDQLNTQVSSTVESTSVLTDNNEGEHLNVLYGHCGSDQSFISMKEDQQSNMIYSTPEHDRIEEDLLSETQEDTKTHNGNERMNEASSESPLWIPPPLWKL